MRMTTQANITPDQAAAMLAAEAAPAANDNAAEVADAGAQPAMPASTTNADALVMSQSEQEAMQEAVADPKRTAELVVFPAVFKNAEANLAKYIGSKISTELTQELKLDLKVKTGDDRTGKTKSDLVLYLQGDLVDANSALLESQVMKALQEIPGVAPFFNTEHKPRTSNSNDYPNTLHVIIPNLAIAQYAHLIQSLAAGIDASPTHVNAPAPAHHADATPDHQCSGAGCSQCAAPAAQAPAVVEAAPDATASTSVVADETQTHPAATVAAEAQANAAQAVAGGVPAPQVADVNRQGMTNLNSVVPTQTAVGFNR